MYLMDVLLNLQQTVLKNNLNRFKNELKIVLKKDVVESPYNFRIFVYVVTRITYEVYALRNCKKSRIRKTSKIVRSIHGYVV